MREASAIMSKGTSNLVKARAKLAALEKDARRLQKIASKACAAAEKVVTKMNAQATKVAAMEPAPSAGDPVGNPDLTQT